MRQWNTNFVIEIFVIFLFSVKASTLPECFSLIKNANRYYLWSPLLQHPKGLRKAEKLWEASVLKIILSDILTNNCCWLVLPNELQWMQLTSAQMTMTSFAVRQCPFWPHHAHTSAHTIHKWSHTPNIHMCVLAGYLHYT